MSGDGSPGKTMHDSDLYMREHLIKKGEKHAAGSARAYQG